MHEINDIIRLPESIETAGSHENDETFPMPDDSETIELPENSGSVDSRLNIPYTICTGTSLNKEFLYTTDDRQLFIKNSKNKAGTIQYYKCRLFVRQFVVSKQKPKATFTYRPRGVLSSQFVQNSYEE